MAATAAPPPASTGPIRSGSVPAHAPTAADLERLAGFAHVVVSWIDDRGYPLSVATSFEADPAGLALTLASPAGPTIPSDRELSVTGSHIRPKPGEGYDQRRYLQLWGRATGAGAGRGRVLFTPTRAWGWDENEVPFFEYSERSVPQSRRYLAALSAEKGRRIKPRLSPFWLALRTTRLPFLSATGVPVLLGIAIAAVHGSFTWWTAALTLIGGSLAHLGINVSNDVFDTLSGADEANTTPTQFSGGSRVAIYELLSVAQLALLSGALLAGAAAIGIFLVWVTGSQTLLWIGVAGVAIGLAYTAPPLKLVYRGLGEVAVGLGFVPVMLLGAYVVQTGGLGWPPAWEPVIVSIVVGIFVALVLYVNEIPDRRSDGATGKRTLPVRLAPSTVRIGYIALASDAFALVAVGVLLGVLPWPTLLALAAAPLAWRVYRGLEAHYDSPYTLMAVMGQNVNLMVLVGALLLAGYAATLVFGAFGISAYL